MAVLKDKCSCESFVLKRLQNQEFKGCPGERLNTKEKSAFAVRFPVVSHVGVAAF
jgi:hypothetical protein